MAAVPSEMRVLEDCPRCLRGGASDPIKPPIAVRQIEWLAPAALPKGVQTDLWVLFAFVGFLRRESHVQFVGTSLLHQTRLR